MGKLAPDSMIDAALDYVAGSDYFCVCSGSPATFADAFTTLMLARAQVASAIIPVFSLTVQNAQQLQTADNITLDGHVPTFSLTVQNATQAQTSENITLAANIPAFVLVVDNATQAQTSSTIVLGFFGGMPTPVSRTFFIAFENRNYIIEYEDRALEIEAENRFYTVPSSTDEYQVEEEDRDFLVED